MVTRDLFFCRHISNRFHRFQGLSPIPINKKNKLDLLTTSQQCEKSAWLPALLPARKRRKAGDRHPRTYFSKGRLTGFKISAGRASPRRSVISFAVVLFTAGLSQDGLKVFIRGFYGLYVIIFHKIIEDVGTDKSRQ